MLVLFRSISVLASDLTTDITLSDDAEVMCRDELNKRMRDLLEDNDKGILEDAFNLANMKLSYKVLEEGGENQTVEKFIKNKFKSISGKDKQNLMKEVKSLYESYGKSIDSNKVSSIIEGISKHNYFPKSQRLSNEEHSVIMLAYKLLDKCDKGVVCINDNDIAITWFMGKVAKKVDEELKDSSISNLLQSSVKSAHLTGGVDENLMSFDRDKLEQLVAENENKINLQLVKLQTKFIQDFDQCRALLESKCFANTLTDSYRNTLKEILNELRDSEVKKTDDPLKIEIVKGLTFNLRNSLLLGEKKKVNLKSEPDSYPTSINFPAKIVKGEVSPNSCGGKEFSPEIKNINLWSFDPLRAVSSAKNYGKPKSLPASKLGMLCELAKLGPIQFHCTPYLKKLVLRTKNADAKVCCKEEVKWEHFNTLFASVSGGIDLKAYLGVPFLDKIGVVGEIGIIGGVGAGINIGGGKVPEGCIDKKCIQGAIRTSVFLGGYLDIGVKRKLNNAIGAEIKVAWKPYLTGRQCLYPEGKLPALEVKYSVGSIWLHGTVYAGWIFTYDFYEPIYERNEEDSFSIPIF